ncbi:hypothetical protein CYMTET_27452 [Cymbomonas tetramitiformis]|uniref:PHD-type domain-containing protein n=1 Tax=Cymbomonas tetramitiformis TaxID=36881 RepID=A0AAE0KX69_9CHLO|nr:hypothetical protein CYMTET_27452 [Cymbomonas tetramitiformis]
MGHARPSPARPAASRATKSLARLTPRVCAFSPPPATSPPPMASTPPVTSPPPVASRRRRAWPVATPRICAFCRGGEDGQYGCMAEAEGRAMHELCAVWSPGCYHSDDGKLCGVAKELRRGRMLRCTWCGSLGATIGCLKGTCRENFHLPCAAAAQCQLDQEMFGLRCPKHAIQGEQAHVAAGDAERMDTDGWRWRAACGNARELSGEVTESRADACPRDAACGQLALTVAADAAARRGGHAEAAAQQGGMGAAGCPELAVTTVSQDVLRRGKLSQPLDVGICGGERERSLSPVYTRALEERPLSPVYTRAPEAETGAQREARDDPWAQPADGVDDASTQEGAAPGTGEADTRYASRVRKAEDAAAGRVRLSCKRVFRKAGLIQSKQCTSSSPSPHGSDGPGCAAGISSIAASGCSEAVKRGRNVEVRRDVMMEWGLEREVEAKLDVARAAGQRVLISAPSQEARVARPECRVVARGCSEAVNGTRNVEVRRNVTMEWGLEREAEVKPDVAQWASQRGRISPTQESREARPELRRDTSCHPARGDGSHGGARGAGAQGVQHESQSVVTPTGAGGGGACRRPALCSKRRPSAEVTESAADASTEDAAADASTEDAAADASTEDAAADASTEDVGLRGGCSRTSVSPGTRIEVYWQDDAAFYAGVVQHYTEEGKAFVQYDDGDVETLDLALETYKLLGDSLVVTETGLNDENLTCGDTDTMETGACDSRLRPADAATDGGAGGEGSGQQGSTATTAAAAVAPERRDVDTGARDAVCRDEWHPKPEQADAQPASFAGAAACTGARVPDQAAVGTKSISGGSLLYAVWITLTRAHSQGHSHLHIKDIYERTNKAKTVAEGFYDWSRSKTPKSSISAVITTNKTLIFWPLGDGKVALRHKKVDQSI